MKQRDVTQFLKEKWFLVAADFITVLGILSVGFDSKDAWQATLVFLGIMGGALIVVIPVMMDQGSKSDRLAELTRLRAALAAEIDKVQDSVRAATESFTRRSAEIEISQQKASEAAVAALAQKASAEINTLKAALADLEKKLAASEKALKEAQAKLGAVEEVKTEISDLAGALNKSEGQVDQLNQALEGLKAAQAKASDQHEHEVRAAKKSADKLEEKLKDAIADWSEQLKSLEGRLTSAPAVEREKAEAPQAEVTEEVAAEAEVATSESTPEVVPARPSRSRAKKKEEVVTEDELPIQEAEEGAAASSAEPVAATGGTALIINLMIGIGNKPYVRGTGPGLSPDKGVAMEFLGIGRWQWVSPEPDAPATVEVWKNDQSPVGEPLHLSGGAPVEVDEGHFMGG